MGIKDRAQLSLKIRELTDPALKEANDAPSEFYCPISMCIMDDPVVSEDGHTYERASIMKWLETHSKSPKTNMPMGGRFMPNYALKSMIIEFNQKRDRQE